MEFEASDSPVEQDQGRRLPAAAELDAGVGREDDVVVDGQIRQNEEWPLVALAL